MAAISRVAWITAKPYPPVGAAGQWKTLLGFPRYGDCRHRGQAAAGTALTVGAAHGRDQPRGLDNGEAFHRSKQPASGKRCAVFHATVSAGIAVKPPQAPR
ncbi:hypothetical protein [Pseudomonas oryzihabitans]|uniref:hypothetical protein n=1 Tax=Pseudomonas oryzihabitans TaxID=47885 RepID=UPI002893D75C|nr:hypothetical protein [Pseudomonas oryzihabitans]MDT3719958.1 hypothetical protein [Pseudomonas oryzihabitans]